MDQTDYPPFATKDTAGKWTGWEVELGLAVCEAAKIKCELFPTAWDGIIPALQEGKIDFIFASMTINPDRKQQVNFTHFYYDTQTVIVGNKSDTTKIDFDNPDSVKGKVFGAQNATIHSKFLQAASARPPRSRPMTASTPRSPTSAPAAWTTCRKASSPSSRS